MTGSVLGLKRSSTGAFASSGSRSTSSLSRTSRLAWSMSVPQANSSTTSLWPVRGPGVGGQRAAGAAAGIDHLHFRAVANRDLAGGDDLVALLQAGTDFGDLAIGIAQLHGNALGLVALYDVDGRLTLVLEQRHA